MDTDSTIVNILTTSQGRVLVYVTAILVIMARQFRRLDTIEEDINKCLVVNSQGNTNVETVR